MIFLTIISLIVILLISTWLWDTLEKYEKGTPENYIHQFINATQNADTADLMKKVGIEETDFFSAEDYKVYMQGILGTEASKVLISEVGVEAETKNNLYELHLSEKSGIVIELIKSSGEEGGYSIQQQSIPLGNMTIHAPSNITIFADDIELADKYKDSADGESARILTIPNEKITLPTMQVYHINGFLKEPVITAENISDGELKQEKEGEILTIKNVPLAKEKEKLEALAQNAAKEYAKFVSNDGEFASYEKYVLSGTPYYNSLRNFDNQWYVAHSGYKFANIITQDTVAYSERVFSTDISFDYIITKNKEDHVYPTKYRMYFLKHGSEYKIIEMEII